MDLPFDQKHCPAMPVVQLDRSVAVAAMVAVVLVVVVDVDGNHHWVEVGS